MPERVSGRGIGALRITNLAGFLVVFGMWLLADLNGEVCGLRESLSLTIVAGACAITMVSGVGAMILERKPRALPVFSLVFCLVAIAGALCELWLEWR